MNDLLQVSSASASSSQHGGGGGGGSSITDSMMQPPTLHFVLYAQNPKGKSEKFVLDDISLNDAEKRTG